jgi:hypothetical protein
MCEIRVLVKEGLSGPLLNEDTARRQSFMNQDTDSDQMPDLPVT